jgi:AraC family transcriptional regulator
MHRDDNSSDDFRNVQLPRIHIVGDVAKKAGTGLGPRTIHDYEVLFFPGGTQSVYRVEEKAYLLNEPSFIITRPGEIHSYEYDALLPSQHLFIHFGIPETTPMMELLPLLRPGGPSCIPLDQELPTGMMKQILHIAYAYPERLPDRGSALLLSLLTELNGAIFDNPSVKQINELPPQIVKALDYIDKHLDEQISVERLANRMGWSHEHFSRSFVHYMGRTPRETIIQRRIERACQFLLYEEWSIKEIAYRVGFTDENYFSRLFKNVKGLTASHYRKKYYNPFYLDLYPVKGTHSLYPVNRILFNIGAN